MDPEAARERMVIELGIELRRLEFVVLCGEEPPTARLTPKHSAVARALIDAGWRNGPL